MRILVVSLLIHALWASVGPSSWWVPNVTLVGLIFSVARAPTQWLWLSMVAGLWLMVWAIRFPVPVMMSALLLGWLVSFLAKHWDATDLRVQWVLATTASFLSVLAMLWLDGFWSVSLLGLACGHSLLTGLVVPIARSLLHVDGVSG